MRSPRQAARCDTLHGLATRAVDDVSLAVDEGEIFGVLSARAAPDDDRETDSHASR
ncbi:hypothetical protein [Nonomuraea roseola]|uniref:Uncharacterized protein n=1 Tax=Nonomuraea roseola TaxID=46179 RepID=A0ABV5Q6M7_9ACTN